MGALRAAVATTDDLRRTRLRASLDAALLIGSLLPLGNVASTAVNVLDAAINLKPTARQLKSAFTPFDVRIAVAKSVPVGDTISVDGPFAAHMAAENEGLTLARLAAILPFAAVVDNAECLDRPTVEVLKAMSRHDGATGLIVLAINSDLEPLRRASDDNTALETWLDEQRRTYPEQVRELVLHPLTEDESITVGWHHITTRYGLQPSSVDAARLAEIITASSGRPGRVADLLQSRAVRGALTTSGVALPDLNRITRLDVWSRPSPIYWKISRLPCARLRSMVPSCPAIGFLRPSPMRP